MIAPVSFTVFGAHPRSRGDHGRGASARLVIVGSSPLARGPLPAPAARMTLRGLIPARAGTTAWMRGTHRVRRAHPRSRGDHPIRSRGRCRGRGSSPLARGPPCVPHGCPSCFGLIPARAGTTWRYPRSKVDGGAHPRSRGDHQFNLEAGCTERGSSPLARGPRRFRRLRITTTGLIPARAGTTARYSPKFIRYGAHPRSRGDHFTAEENGGEFPGSSPLARGPQISKTVVSMVIGLIPARAGTTDFTSDTGARAGAHPRSRGDHPPVL